jgi:hypothetical protein
MQFDFDFDPDIKNVHFGVRSCITMVSFDIYHFLHKKVKTQVLNSLLEK